MNYPIFNISEHFKGVFFYLESGSFSNWIAAPSNNPWVSSTPTSVGGRTIINAHKEYITDIDLIKEFSANKGGVSVTPISIKDYSGKLTFNFPFSSGHQVHLDVINSLPYPSLSFSANLMNAASDFRSVLKDITEQLKSDTLLVGKLTMFFQGIELVNKIALNYNLRKILKQLVQKFPIPFITRTNLQEETNMFVRSNLKSIAPSTFGTLSVLEENKLVDYLSRLFTDSFIAMKSLDGCFDGKAVFEKIVLRDPLELQDTDVKSSLLNTLTVTHQLSF